MLTFYQLLPAREVPLASQCSHLGAHEPKKISAHSLLSWACERSYK